jgi:chemotaxis protein MotA
MQFFIGLMIVVVAVFGGFMFHGGELSVIWEPVELVIIIGAGIGALVIGNPKHVLSELLLQVRHALGKPRDGNEFHRQLLLLMYELLQTAAGGLKALDAHVEAPQESEMFQRYPLILANAKLLNFIVDNFRLMAMGKISAHELEGVLEQEIEAMHEELNQPNKSLQKIAEAMPGFGIIAAVLGIVMAMNTIGSGASSAEIAEKVGAAMVGTFIGIFMSYCLLDPLSNALKQLVTEEQSMLEIVKVVLVTHVAGKPALLAIDAGRRLVQLNTKPSFATLEGWIISLSEASEPEPANGRRATDRA